jgi:hypothetical protein
MVLSTIGQGPTLIDGFIRAVMAHLAMVKDRGMAPLFTEIRAESMRNETVRNACNKNENQVMEAFRAFFNYGVMRGEIDPIEDINTVVHVMLAIGEGIIMSDLTEKGVTHAKIETIFRAMVHSVLRPNLDKQNQSTTTTSPESQSHA